MPQFSQVSTVLRVPINNFSALTTGVSLVAISRSFIREGQQFVLVESGFNADSEESTIAYWASCVSSQVIEECHDIDYLSKITHLSVDQVQKKLEENSTFLAFLRVYQIPIKIQQSLQFNRQFAALTAPIAVVDEFPLISQQAFEKRKKQIQDCTPSEHPDLEALQSTIAHYAKTNLDAKALNEDLKAFLGWTDSPELAKAIPPWVKEITESGNSSDGNLFEKCVRLGFITLGFTNTLKNIKASLDPDATGGAGGIDIYCEKPYSIVGECKASKHDSVPNSVSAQLIHLGNTHLGKETFDASIKIIFASGKLTDHAEKAAIENQINVMRPETLQRLVELKTAHPGSINLLELKPHLEAIPFGTDADTKVNDFIAKIWQKIETRSQVIQAVKALKTDGDDLVNASDVRNRFNAFASPEDKFFKPEDTHNLLIELSSPLTGYLGRTKGNTWKDDRFYFLRDLIV